jgi:ribosomal protein S27E
MMTLHPFDEVAANMERKVNQGMSVFQQWKCEHCGAKQTMPDRNRAYMKGTCEECGKETDIVRTGMNFMLVSGVSDEILDEITKEE